MPYTDTKCRRYAQRTDGQGFTRCRNEGIGEREMAGEKVWLCGEPCTFTYEITDSPGRFIFIPNEPESESSC
jgi:hypothetical protein